VRHRAPPPALALATSASAVDLSVSSIEISQGYQAAAGTTPLVAKNATIVRVKVSLNGQTTPQAGVDAVLRIYANGVEIPTSPVYSTNGPISAPASPNSANINDTLNFHCLPPQSTDVDFVVTVNPFRTVLETNYENNTLSANNKNFVCRKFVDIAYTPVNYTFGGSGSIGGAGLLTKAGPGTLSLLAAHQSTAGLAVTGGTVEVGSATTAGSVAGPVSVAAGSTFRVRRGTAAGLVTVNGGLAEVAGGTLSGGAMVTTGTLALGSNSGLAGAVSVAASEPVTRKPAATWRVAGVRVKSAGSSQTCIVSPVGTLAARLPLHVPAVLQADVPLLDAWTPARRLAVVWPAACAAALAIRLIPRTRRTP
jgi:hypothetical protein